MYQPSPHFPEAKADYLLLMNRGYPQKSSVKMVGDRWELPGIERSLLQRGIAPAATAYLRRMRLIQSEMPGLDLSGKPLLGIDGYNVLFTMLHHYRGECLFSANDGLLRDTGAAFGRIVDTTLFNRVMSEFASYLSALLSGLFDTVDRISAGPAVIVYLDSPVSYSGSHAAQLRSLCSERYVSVETVKSADYPLKKKCFSVIATSDSAIIDATEAKILDIPRHMLESKGCAFFDLGGSAE
jgi:hypothetical protein